MERKMIEFARPDGGKAPGYLAVPPGGDRAPAVIVIQEWWGLNPQIKGVADRLAELGFRALVPDLFRGKLTTDSDEASHWMNGLDFGQASGQDIRGAAMHLKQWAPGKVAALGFCMGGALTILSSLRVPEIDAGVCFYGIPPREAGDPASIKVPLQCHFATHDDWCTPERIGDLERGLAAGKVNFEIHRYDAEHAFMNEARPEVYDAASAKLAWERATRFLDQMLR